MRWTVQSGFPVEVQSTLDRRELYFTRIEVEQKCLEPVNVPVIGTSWAEFG